MISPGARRRAAAGLVVVTVAGWPLSALWLAKDEPPFVLGLSWAALTLTALDILATSVVREQEDNR